MAALAASFFSTAADAACGTTWTDGNGSWTVAGNWSAGVPTSGTNACIIDGTSSVTLSGTGSTASLQLGTGNALDIAANSQLQVFGSSISNAGAITVNGGGGFNAILDIVGTATLSGGGAVNLTTAAGGGEALLQGIGASPTLTNTDNTIQGAGAIGFGGLAFDNKATVEANAAGQFLNLLGTVTNTSLLEATNGATLSIQGNVTNTGGNITADGAGSTVAMSANATITGGTLNTKNGGVMQTAGGSSATLDGVAIASGSTYIASNNSTTSLQGTITNHGTLQVNGGGGFNAILDIVGTATLSGGGAVNLTTAAGGGEALLQGIGAGPTLTNTDNTIQGAGAVGFGGLAVVNQPGGTLLANAPGQNLAITIGSLTNNGVMEVNPGSGLIVTSTFTNFSGNTLTDGTYIVNGATSNTGTMQLSPLGNNVGGEIVDNAASIILNGPTANTLLVNAGGNNALKPLAVNKTAASILTLVGGYGFTTVGSFSNAGAVTIGPASTDIGSGGADNYTQSGGGTKVDGTLASAHVAIDGGFLQGTGTVIGNVTNLGAVQPGDSPGTLTVIGNYTQNPSGIFAVELGGLSPGQFSKLAVEGMASLAGQIDVSPVNAFDPTSGDSFDIMSFLSEAGDFSSFTFDGLACSSGGADKWDCTNLPAGLFFQEVFQASDLLLEVNGAGPPPPAPEPGSLALLGPSLGIFFLIGRARRVRTVGSRRAPRPWRTTGRSNHFR